MACPFNLDVQESAEYLSKSLKNARTAFKKERSQFSMKYFSMKYLQDKNNLH